MNMNIIFSVLILVFSVNSYAGNDWSETGNGGFVVMCPDKSIVLDLHEAVVQGSVVIDSNSKSLTSIENRVHYLIDRLEEKDFYRAELYRLWFKDFFKETQFIQGQKLYPVPDVGFTYIPKECTLDLAVFQKTPDFRLKYRYTISQDIWDQLDTLNKAALIMHELIYREATLPENRHQTSESARFFNGWLHSMEFAEVVPQDYLIALQSLRFKNASYGGFQITLGMKGQHNQWITAPLKFYDNGNLMSAITTKFDLPTLKGFQSFRHCFINSERHSTTVAFKEDGSVDRLDAAFSKAFACDFYEIDGINLSFFADGRTYGFGFAREDIIILKNVTISVEEETRVGLYISATGEIESIDLERPPCWDRNHVALHPFGRAAKYNVKNLTKEKLPACFQ